MIRLVFLDSDTKVTTPVAHYIHVVDNFLEKRKNEDL